MLVINRWIFVFIICLYFAVYYSDFLGQIGRADFIEYWSSLRLFLENKNLYNPSLMQAIQVSLGRSEPEPLMMWNPPWLLFLMFPVLFFSFEHASVIWFVVSCFLMFLGSAFSWKAFNKSSSISFEGVVLLVAANIFPVWICLKLGQIGILLYALSSLLWFFLSKGKYFCAGVVFFMLSVKPHLFYLLFLSVFFWFFNGKKKHVLNFALGSMLSLIIFVGLSILINKDSVFYWFSSIISPLSGVTKPQDWIVATLVSPFRELLFLCFGITSAWGMFILPLITSCMFSFWLFKNKKMFKEDDPWKKLFPLSISIGLLTSMYGWVSDFALLSISILPVIYLLINVKFPYKIVILSVLLMFQFISAFLSRAVLTEHHHFWWYPCLFLLIFFLAKNTNGSVAKCELSHKASNFS